MLSEAKLDASCHTTQFNLEEINMGMGLLSLYGKVLLVQGNKKLKLKLVTLVILKTLLTKQSGYVSLSIGFHIENLLLFDEMITFLSELTEKYDTSVVTENFAIYINLN